MTQRMTPYQKRQLLREIMLAGGFYVTDCRPQAIKAGCERWDCPMRALAIPPEADENDRLLECDPPGHLADLLLLLKATTPYLHPSRQDRNDP
ncbi:MAG: hypothetical protein BroJett011_62050 [Chloroflexota bacterium]|nr:MAG: hypothetical protein BroJett011_62050 [Chloroflexota bacterium]